MASKKFSITDSTQTGSAKNPSNQRPDLHGAAILDENGVETPITEHMIQMACNQLICDWESSLNSNH